jgi:hypothetical protein
MPNRDAETLRDYALREQQLAAPLASWELAMPMPRVRRAIKELCARGILRELEPQVPGSLGGPAIYGYVPIQPVARRQPLGLQEPLPAADLAPAGRGKVVPLTGAAQGPADRPGRTKKAQAAGHRVKRAKMQGHS